MSGPVGNIQRLVPGLIEKVNPANQLGAAKEIKDSSFTELFSNLLNATNDAQHDSKAIQDALLAGDPVELHEVMIKAEEAGLTMDLLLEIRNKLVEAYHEMMRMPL